MSVRTDLMDVGAEIACLVDRITEVNYSYGARQADVETALQLLLKQIGEAANSVEAAFLRNEIDIAEQTKRNAEERIAELGKALA